MTPAIKSVQVLPGSIVLFSNIILAGEDEDYSSLMRGVLDELVRCIGHSQFALVTTQGDGDVEVWGPADDLAAKVKALLG